MTRTAPALLLAAFGLTFLGGPWGDERVSDLFLYRSYAGAFLDGVLPYRDVAFEYPPLAAPLLALGGVAGTGEEAYRIGFAVLTLGLAFAVLALTGALAGRTGGDRRVALAAIALMPLLTGAMIRTHFDLAPVALTLAALLLLCAGHPRLGFAVLGAGVMTKGFPLVVAPVALAWLLARGQRRDALLATGALVLGSLAAVVAFACLGKVLSPQFLIWVAPLTALAWAWRMHALAAAATGATLLTLLEFPAHYADVVGREPVWLSVVALRNVLLVAVVGLAVRALLVSPLDATEGSAARRRSRGRRPPPRPAPR